MRVVRLGEPDKAINFFKQSSSKDHSTSADVARAQSVKSRIAKCNDARKLRDWITVLQESQAAVSDGADCAPQVSLRPPACHAMAYQPLDLTDTSERPRWIC